MSNKIGSVIIDVQADTQKLVNGMEHAQKTMTNATNTMKKSVVGLAAAYLSFESVNAFAGTIKGSIDAADNLSLVSEKLAISSEALSKLEYAAGFAGVSMGTLNASLSAMIRRTTNFKRDGGGAAANAMDTLGISADFARKNFTTTEATFKILLDRLAKMPDGVQKTAAAQDLFSKSAADVIRLANLGTEEIQRLGIEGEKLGVVFSDHMVAQSANFNEELSLTQLRIQGVSNSLAAGLVPILTVGTQRFNEFTESTNLNSKTIQDFTIDTIAYIGKTIDTLNFMYETLENTGQSLVFGLNYTVYGALRSVVGFAAKATEALNAIGLSSNETLASISTLYASMDKAYKDSKIGMSDSVNEIGAAMKKMNVSVEDRISLMKSEIKLNETTFLLNKKIKDDQDAKNQKDLDDASAKKRLSEESIKDSKDEAKATLELEKANQRVHNSFIKVTGTNYDKWLLETNNKLIELSETGTLTAVELQKAYDAMSQDFDAKEIDEVNKNYITMLDAQIELVESTNNWQNGLTGIASTIDSLGKGFSKLSADNLKHTKAQFLLDKQYAKDKAIYAKEPIKLKELESKYETDNNKLRERHQENQLIGYANIAGSMSLMFKEGSDGANAMMTISSALATVNAVKGVLSAMDGDPYTMAARVAAAVATASALLGHIGQTFGFSKMKVSSDSFSAQAENEGKGSILGDATAQSKSIQNSLGILEDFAQPEFALMSQMTKSLKSIEMNIGGLTGNLIKNGGFALGEDAALKQYKSVKNRFDDIYDSTLDTLSFGNEWLQLAMNITTLGLGKITSSVMGGLFGKTSQSLADSGLNFNPQLISKAISNLDGQSYQSITTTKKSWFKKSSSTASYFKDLDKETERQFSLVLSNLYNTAIFAGEALDTTSQQVENELSDFYVRIGKISLKGKTGDQIQEQLTSIFGKIGDELSADAFPGLIPFQKVGEGLFETMTRVSTGMEEAEYYINRLGHAFEDIKYTNLENKQGDVSLEVLTQSILDFEEANNGANSSLIPLIENINGTADDLFQVYKSLDLLRDKLIFLNVDTNALTSSMLLGANGTNALKDAFESYFENYLEESLQLDFKIESLTKEFEKLGLTLPKTKVAFSNLLNAQDLTSESGQELYGRILLLADSFAQVTEAAKEAKEVTEAAKEAKEAEYLSSIATLENNLSSVVQNSYKESMNTIESMFKNINSMALSTEDTIRDIKFSNPNKEESESEKVIAYNKLLKEFSIAKNENNMDKASLIYKDFLSVSKDLASNDNYRDEILSNLENNTFDFEKEVMKVSIVSGLGTLANLSVDQAGQLGIAIKDGFLTQAEIAAMSLTDEQKTAIKTTGDNSGLFSTETTLASLDSLSKKQLLLLEAAQLVDTQSLSRETLQYGDVIGLQEQIDISKLLGMSYENAAPFIEELQNLSISTSLQEDINKMLEYTKGSTTYDAEMYDKLSKFFNVLDPKIKGKIQNIPVYTESNSIMLEQIAKYQAEFDREKTEADTAKSMYEHIAWFLKATDGELIEENYATGDYLHEKGATYYLADSVSEDLQTYYDEFQEALSVYNTLEYYKNAFKLQSFAVGTPYLPTDQIIQAHKGEMIVPETFNDGVRNGEITIGKNSKLESSLNDLIQINIAQAKEIRDMRYSIDEMNQRNLISNAKGVN